MRTPPHCLKKNGTAATWHWSRIDRTQSAATGRAPGPLPFALLAGRYDEAIRMMKGRRFEVWAGGSLSVANNWASAHLLRAKRRRSEGHYQEALANIQAAGQIPDNLPSDQDGEKAHAVEIAYATGEHHEALGSKEQSHTAWEQAAASRSREEPGRGGGPSGLKGSVARYFRGWL